MAEDAGASSTGRLRRQTTVASPGVDEEHPVTPEWELEMVELYESGQHREFQMGMSKMLMTYPKVFRTMDLGEGDDGDNRIELDELIAHFEGKMNPKLVKLMHESIVEAEKTSRMMLRKVSTKSALTDIPSDSEEDSGPSISFLSFHKFTQGRSMTVKSVVVEHDPEWLFKKLKEMNFKDLDSESGDEVTRAEFHDMFDSEMKSVGIVDAVFDAIDRNGDGGITPMEFFRWRNGFSFKKFQKMVKDVEAKGPPPIDPYKEGDKVKLKDGRKGQVKAVIVNPDDSQDVTYGIRLLYDGSGNSDGTRGVDPEQYFVCPVNSGEFVSHPMIEGSTEFEQSFMGEPYHTGTKVELMDGTKGQVKWIGLDDKGRTTYGVRLVEESKDDFQLDGDGVFTKAVRGDDKRKFHAPPKHAVFVRAIHMRGLLPKGEDADWDFMDEMKDLPIEEEESKDDGKVEEPPPPVLEKPTPVVEPEPEIKDEFGSDDWEKDALAAYNDGQKKEFKRLCSMEMQPREDHYQSFDLCGEGSPDEETRVSKEQLMKHFDGKISEDVLNAIYEELSSVDDKEGFNYGQFLRFVSNKPLKPVVIPTLSRKDAKFLLQKLKKLDLRELDDDENFQVELPELQAWADQFGIAPWLTGIVFELIDDDGNGHITPMEFFKWRNNITLKDFQKLVRLRSESLSLEDHSIEAMDVGTKVALVDGREGMIKCVLINPHDHNDVKYGIRLTKDGTGDCSSCGETIHDRRESVAVGAAALAAAAMSPRSDGGDAAEKPAGFLTDKDCATVVPHEQVASVIKSIAADWDFSGEPYARGDCVSLTLARHNAEAQVKWVGTDKNGCTVYGLRLVKQSDDPDQPAGDGIMPESVPSASGIAIAGDGERKFEAPKGFALFVKAIDIKKVLMPAERVLDGFAPFDYLGEPYSVGSKVRVRMESAELAELEEAKAKELRAKLAAFHAEASRKIEEAKEVERKANRESYELTQKADALEKQLEEARYEVANSQTLISKIEKKHWDELKAYKKPPMKVKSTLEAVVILVGPKKVGLKKPKKGAGFEWNDLKRAVSKPGFVKTVLAHKPESVKPSTLAYVKKNFVSKDYFTYDSIQASSQACGPLALWVLGQVSNDELLRNEDELLQEVADLRAEMKKHEEKARESHALVAELEAEEAALSKQADEADQRVCDLRTGSGEASTVDGQIKYMKKPEDGEGDACTFGVRLREAAGDCDGTEEKSGERLFFAPKDFGKFVYSPYNIIGLAKDQRFDYMNEPFAIGDKVRLWDGTLAQVKYLSGDGSDGELVVLGVRTREKHFGMDDENMVPGLFAVNNGSFEGEQRFKCKDGFGVFIDCGLVFEKLDPESGEALAFDFSHETYKPSDKVVLKDGRIGQVKWVGMTDPDYGKPMMGLRMMEPRDDQTNGELEECQRFLSPLKCAAFVHPSEIAKVLPDDSKKCKDFMWEPYSVGSKVRLKDGRVGQVKWVSPTQEYGPGKLIKVSPVMKGTDEIVFGIRIAGKPDETPEMMQTDGRLTGDRSVTDRDEQYFDSAPFSTAYVTFDQIEAPAEDDEFEYMDEPYAEGDRITLKDGREAQIKYVGQMKDKTAIFGIRLHDEDAQGDTDGLYKKEDGSYIRPFGCPADKGLYVDIEAIEERIPEDEEPLWSYMDENVGGDIPEIEESMSYAGYATAESEVEDDTTYEIGDKVLLKDGRIGQIKAKVLDKDGTTLYGIRLRKEDNGDSDGSYTNADGEDEKAFVCPENKAVFVPKSAIKERLPADGGAAAAGGAGGSAGGFDFMAEPFKEGDKIELNDGRVGQIKWIGTDSDLADSKVDEGRVFAGVRLHPDSQGNCDGTVTKSKDKHRHFECAPNSGVYIPIDDGLQVKGKLPDDGSVKWDYMNEKVEQPQPTVDVVVDPDSEGVDPALQLSVGDQIWVSATESGKDRECRVISVGGTDEANELATECGDESPCVTDPNFVKIHYVSYHSRFDEWINLTDPRIRRSPPAQTAFDLTIDDTCSVFHFGYQKWIVAEVDAINITSDSTGAAISTMGTTGESARSPLGERTISERDDYNDSETGIKFRYVGTDQAEWVDPNSDRISLVIKNPGDPYTGVRGESYYVRPFLMYALSPEDEVDQTQLLMQDAQEGGASKEGGDEGSGCLVM